MWINTSFSTWEVEGRVKERVENALQEAEKGRLAKEVMRGKSHRDANRPNFALRNTIQILVLFTGWVKILFR